MAAVEKTVAPGAETPASQANDDRLKKFRQLVRDLGTASGAGKDALPKLGHAVAQAASDGIISVGSPKDNKIKSKFLVNKDNSPKLINDVGEVYENYVSSEGKKAIHERNEKSVASQVSKLMNFYHLGKLPTIDGVEVLDRATKIYKAANPEIYKNPDAKTAYEFYQDVAKTQIKGDQATTALTDDEIDALVWKGDGTAKTLEGELKRAMKILETLISGEGKDKIQDTDERTMDAYQKIKERVDALVTLAKIADLKAKLAELNA